SNTEIASVPSPGLRPPSPTGRGIAPDLRALLIASEVIDGPAELRGYAYDASFFTQLNPREPDCAVIARSVEDVSAVLRYATDRGLGAGVGGGSGRRLGDRDGRRRLARQAVVGRARADQAAGRFGGHAGRVHEAAAEDDADPAGAGAGDGPVRRARERRRGGPG